MKRGVKSGNIPWNKNAGTGWINKRGYHCIKVDGKEKKVHRILMEQHIGRKLMPHEDVHHIDENKLNNDISNLELKTHSEHSRHTNLNRKYKSGRKNILSESERKARSENMKAKHAAGQIPHPTGKRKFKAKAALAKANPQ